MVKNHGKKSIGLEGEKEFKSALADAYIPLKALTDLRFRSFKKARELSTLRKKVEAEVDFYMQEEKKIVET